MFSRSDVASKCCLNCYDEILASEEQCYIGENMVGSCCIHGDSGDYWCSSLSKQDRSMESATSKAWSRVNIM